MAGIHSASLSQEQDVRHVPVHVILSWAWTDWIPRIIAFMCVYTIYSIYMRKNPCWPNFQLLWTPELSLPLYGIHLIQKPRLESILDVLRTQLLEVPIATGGGFSANPFMKNIIVCKSSTTITTHKPPTLASNMLKDMHRYAIRDPIFCSSCLMIQTSNAIESSHLRKNLDVHGGVRDTWCRFKVYLRCLHLLSFVVVVRGVMGSPVEDIYRMYCIYYYISHIHVYYMYIYTHRICKIYRF